MCKLFRKDNIKNEWWDLDSNYKEGKLVMSQYRRYRILELTMIRPLMFFDRLMEKVGR